MVPVRGATVLINTSWADAHMVTHQGIIKCFNRVFSLQNILLGQGEMKKSSPRSEQTLKIKYCRGRSGPRCYITVHSCPQPFTECFLDLVLYVSNRFAEPRPFQYWWIKSYKSPNNKIYQSWCSSYCLKPPWTIDGKDLDPSSHC